MFFVSPVRVAAEPFYPWHFANAFERGGELVIDDVRHPDDGTFYDISRFAHGAPQRCHGTLHRARLELAARTLRSEPVSDRSCEFPTVAPGEQNREPVRTYVALDDLSGIGAIEARGEIQAHALRGDTRATEPVVVGGHVLSRCHTRDRAFLAIYDAARLPEGPVAKVWLDPDVPITFHRTFRADLPA